MHEPETGRFDVYAAVTDAIVAAIEAGVGTTQCPWHGSGWDRMPQNALTKKRYNGVNVIALWAASMRFGYHSASWATYRQWQQLGAHVRKGQRGSIIVFYKKMDAEVEDPRSGETRHYAKLIARASKVFCADQVDGYSADIPPPTRDLVERIHSVDQFIRDTGADIRHRGTQAYYNPAADYISIPESHMFVGTDTSTATESYYGVLLHELIHWTGAPQRIERDLSGRFGGQAYAMEELIAELGAAFLCAQLEIASTPRQDHAAYIASWLEVLRKDKRAMFTAAARASDATEYLTYM